MIGIVMVRNEARILRRCVESLSVCDQILVVDTGSDDDTVKIARELGCIVREHPWRDFGTNRSLSFKEAQGMGEWCLVIDADMKLVGGEGLRDFLGASSEAGHTLLQKAGDLEYRNVRLMRLSEDWVCKGPTHEYWVCRHGTVGEVPREIAWIDDIGDGGCKADKFERDERLLEAGLREEPENERYLFYLANTKACEGKIEEARELYKRRVSAGGWQEEVWYSMYQLAKLAPDLIEAEMWVQRAISVTDRSEALLWLIERLRGAGQFFKAWGYLQTAAAMAPPGESRLFLEGDWAQRLAFERSILHYYVSPNRDAGMWHCLAALDGPFQSQIRENLKFYARRLGEAVRLEFPTPEGFYSSSLSVTKAGLGNVRCVDYFIEPDGRYRHFQGRVVTRNFRFFYQPRKCIGFDEVFAKPPTHDSWCHGLEDLRLSNDLTFTATCLQWRYPGQPEANRMAVGSYTLGRLDFEVVRPPEETGCEKNWLPLGAGNLLYRWSPFEVGRVEAGALVIHTRHSTPAWWRHLRGSAPPFAVGARTLLVAHLVSDADPRNYFSVVVQIEPATWRPMAASLPFVFFGGIEYCLSAQCFDGEVHFFVSHWDRASYVVVAEVPELYPLTD